MKEEDIQPTWRNLVRQERGLKRNRIMCLVIQPVGALLCLLSLLLASTNIWLFLFGDKIGPYFNKVPILPSLVSKMPRTGWGSIIGSTVIMVYVIPLAVCGVIAGVFYLVTWLKYRKADEPLVGNIAQCAEALAHKAEGNYELRRKIPRWSTYLETGILTVLTAIPIVIMFKNYAASKNPMVLNLVLIALALLFCLFVLFWVYALLLEVFALLNSLFYFSRGEWYLYDQYHRLDDYWESVDPEEFERRQRRATVVVKKPV